MELGLGFDDSDLLTAEKPKIFLTSYNAKICNPEWFLHENADQSDKDQATLDKFGGDFYYKLSDFPKAIDFYSRSLGGLGSQNRTMRREITDSLARCYLNTGFTDRALELADKVLEDCLTRDQICHGLHLKQLIYQKSGHIREEIQIIYQLIHIHPRNVQFWMSLKNVYERQESEMNQTDSSNVKSQGTYLQGNTLNIAGSKRNGNDESIQINGMKTVATELEHLSMSSSGTSKNVVPENVGMNSASMVAQSGTYTSFDVTVNDSSGSLSGGLTAMQDYRDILTGLPCQLLKLTCCIRMRRILKSVQRTVASFIKQKNLELQRKIEEEICSLGVDEKILQRANMCIWKSSDFDDDDNDDENVEKCKTQEDEDKEIPTITPEEFNKRWFSWITEPETTTG